MKRIYALAILAIPLFVLRCIGDSFTYFDTSKLVKNIKLVNEKGDWAKNIEFEKIRLFEIDNDGNFLRDKAGNEYNEVDGVTKAKLIYNNEDESTPTHIQLYLRHHLGYSDVCHFSLKINDSTYHKINVGYDSYKNKLDIKDFSYQGDSLSRTVDNVLEIITEKSEPKPTPPNNKKCEDPNAINRGEDLPCRYPPPPKCEDPNAINRGEDLPCKYPPPPKCEDPNAINRGEDLPCKYPPPRTYPPFKTSGTVYLHSWMKHIDDNAPISALSIPGTHDSGSRKSQEVNITKCQNLDFEEQLNKGIRFLDIRIDSELSINHGGWHQYEDLNMVLEICETFLKFHPTETIIMSIKQEDSDSSNFASIVENVINEKPDLWYLGYRIPKMGEVRGKIILFRRYSNSDLGIPMSYWPDNRTFVSGDVSVQDWYDIGGLSNENIRRKWNEAKALIDKATNREGDQLYVNFLSASGGMATPNQYAWGRKLSWDEWWNIGRETTGVLNHFEYYQKNAMPRSRTYGIMVMDYPSENILRMLVNSNF